MTIISCRYCQTEGLILIKESYGWRVYERFKMADQTYQMGQQHKCEAYYKAKPLKEKKKVTFVKGAKNGGYYET
jgi:hypothetical protein